MNKNTAAARAQGSGTVWKLLMGAIMALFIAILIVVYLIAREANPVILDEKGRPLHSQTGGQ